MAKKTQELSEQELHELEAATAGDDWSGSAPRTAKNFWPSAKRLIGLLGGHKAALAVIGLFNVVCVVLAVVAPKIMGKATDVIFSGVVSRMLPAGTTKEEAVAGLRAAGQDQFADMASGMELHPGSGIDFTRLGQIIILVILMYVVSSLFQLWQAYGSTIWSWVWSTTYASRSRPRSTACR